MKTLNQSFHFAQILLWTMPFCLFSTLSYAETEIDLLTPKTINLNKNWLLEKGVLSISETPGGIIWSKDKFGDFQINLQRQESD
jgi:hypothetical protein